MSTQKTDGHILLMSTTKDAPPQRTHSGGATLVVIAAKMLSS